MSRNESVDYMSKTGYLPVMRRNERMSWIGKSGAEHDIWYRNYESHGVSKDESKYGIYLTKEEMRKVWSTHVTLSSYLSQLDTMDFSPKNKAFISANQASPVEEITITKSGATIYKTGKHVTKSFDDDTPLTTKQIHKLIEGKKVEYIKKMFTPKKDVTSGSIKATTLSSVTAQSTAGVARIRGYAGHMSNKMKAAIVGIFVVIAVLIGRKI